MSRISHVDIWVSMDRYRQGVYQAYRISNEYSRKTFRRKLKARGYRVGYSKQRDVTLTDASYNDIKKMFTSNFLESVRPTQL